MEFNEVIDNMKTKSTHHWMTPFFIGIGRPKEYELVLEQCSSKPDNNIHMGAW